MPRPKYSSEALSDRLEIRELPDRYAAVVDERRCSWRIRRRVCTQTMLLGSLPAGYAVPE